ncbi:MAG: hypothetical protein PF508_09320 [Spirochaeta sp.]|jgi:hypothetical protein|nr:hypothetical protein [Spirochaeta sp.]
MNYEKLTKLSIRNHAELSERWVQDRIADDPALLGLGDLILKDKERNQSGAGRLDLLLQEADSTQRYEVEIQLGKTDESHIIRTTRRYRLIVDPENWTTGQFCSIPASKERDPS